jgi:hypothetical protein
MPVTRRIIDHDEKLKDKLLDVRGPSPERLQRAGEQYIIGGDERSSVRVYHFLDTPLDRLYSRLARKASEDETTRLGVEYAALRKYQRLFVESGMIGSIGSVDPNRTYSPSPAGRSFLASTERQQDCRDEYRRAVIHLNRHPRWGMKQTIVVDNVVNHERSLVIAGFSIGGGKTESSAQERAERILRDAGRRLGIMWGMSK